MPNRRRNEIKPDLKPALKGVVEIVVPKKAPEVSTPVYKYFKDNADYSEKKCTSTEDTRSFRLQIEQHLNEVSQLHERRNVKTDELLTAEDNSNYGCMKTTTNEESINTCFNIIKNAVGQVEIFEKKAERKEAQEINKIPKTNLLMPLEKVKEDAMDFFKGTKVKKEKKLKEKKQPKLLRLDDVQETNAGAVHEIDIQPAVVNRWQEKQGSKLFDNRHDAEEEEEQALLALAMRESIRTAKMERERRVQEGLLYDDLNRDIEMDKLKERGRGISNVLKENDDDAVNNSKKYLPFDEATLASIRSVVMPEPDNVWDEEIKAWNREQELKNAKKEKKPSLNQKLKQLNNYGPSPVEETAPKKQKEKKKSPNKELEKAKEKAEENKENSGELIFVDPEEEEEVKEIKKDNVTPVKDTLTCNVFGDIPEDLIEKNSETSSNFNSAAEMNLHEEKHSMKTDIKTKPLPTLVFRNLSIRPEDKTLPVKSQRTNINNNIVKDDDKYGSSFLCDSATKISDKPKTETKVNLWNLTAKADARGFSTDYQNRRREAAKIDSPDKVPMKKNTPVPQNIDIPKISSPPTKKDYEIFEDIPEIEKGDCNGPFQDFDDSIPKVNINDLSSKTTGPSLKESDLAQQINEQMVFKYLEQVLFKQCLEKELQNINSLYSMNQNLQQPQFPHVSNTAASAAQISFFMNSLMQNSVLGTSQQQQLNNLLLFYNRQMGDISQGSNPLIGNVQQQGVNLSQMTDQQLNSFLQQSSQQSTDFSQFTNQQQPFLQQNSQLTALPQVTDQQQMLNMLQQGNQLTAPAQVTDPQQMLNMLQQRIQQTANPSRISNEELDRLIQLNEQQKAGLSQTTNQQLSSSFQQNSHGRTDVSQVVENPEQLNKFLREGCQQSIQVPDQQPLLNSFQQSVGVTEMKNDQQQIQNSLPQGYQQSPPIQMEDQRHLLGILSNQQPVDPSQAKIEEQKQFENLLRKAKMYHQTGTSPQMTEPQQAVPNSFHQSPQQQAVPNSFHQSSQQPCALHQMHQSAANLPQMQSQQIEGFSQMNKDLHPKFQNLRVSHENFKPQELNNSHVNLTQESSYQQDISEIRHSNRNSDMSNRSNSEEEPSTVEDLKMTILKLKETIARQQQEKELSGGRSESNYSGGSQEHERVEELEENQPAQPAQLAPPPENVPKPGFPNRYAVPFTPHQYIPPQGMYVPNQVPMYYPYAPPWDPRASVGPIPPMPTIPSVAPMPPMPSMPYMGQIMLPVRPPFMQGPL